MTGHSSVEALAKSVTKKHGLNQCRRCAIELQQVLIAAGVKCKVLQLATKARLGFLVMTDPNFELPFSAPNNAAISTSGKHFGVQVGDYVFDNIHKNGIPLSATSAL
ncbi:MAG: hypothetical protein JWO52_5780 [Gammaproteobacteria bacterium]|nr:hypothetical protein [Gammaproteobacteria bacterium]